MAKQAKCGTDIECREMMAQASPGITLGALCACVAGGEEVSFGRSQCWTQMA